MPITKQIFDLHKMNPQEARKLAVDIFESVQSKTFTSDTEEFFCNYILRNKYQIKKIQIYYADNKIIGYVLFRVLEKNIAGKMYGIIRFTTCVLSAYRGANITQAFSRDEIIKYYFSKLFSKINILIFYTANSPASYYTFVRFSPTVYPNPYSLTPNDKKSLLGSIAKIFDIEVNANFTTHFSGFQVYETPEEMEGWKSNPHPVVKYYLQQVPDYHNGQSLVVMVPVTFYSIIYTGITASYDYMLKIMGFRKMSYKRVNEKIDNSESSQDGSSNDQKSRLAASNNAREKVESTSSSFGLLSWLVNGFSSTSNQQYKDLQSRHLSTASKQEYEDHIRIVKSR